MAGVPKVTTQAGKGGAELQQLGAQARYVQDAIGQAGAPIKAVAGVKASGTITVSNNANVSATDTVTVGATTLEFVASDPAAGEVEIGANAGETRDNLLAALQAVAADEGVAVAASSTAAITVTALAEGTAGNAIALAKDCDGVTVSGSGTLASGVNRVLGTPAPAGSVRVDGTDAYIALADCTVDDTSGWYKLTVGSAI